MMEMQQKHGSLPPSLQFHLPPLEGAVVYRFRDVIDAHHPNEQTENIL